jgi:membrane protease YdiL (CAAX protease family)
MGVLLGCVAALAIAPINTDTATAHVLGLGAFLAATVLAPSFILARSDPGVIRYRLLPNRLRRRDVAYVLVSIPVAWVALRLYFTLSPEVARNWVLPPNPESEPLWRLFVGINLVGTWDELFFINICFAVLRSLFPFAVANLGQAVIYTAVVFDMAFTGIGPVFVYLFALTQAALFERSEQLLTVLLVHLIVDYFLFQEIVTAYYPNLQLGWHFGI